MKEEFNIAKGGKKKKKESNKFDILTIFDEEDSDDVEK